MTPNLENLLYKAYPNLFRNRNLPPEESLMYFGISCGDGWYPLINHLSAELESMILDISEGQRADYCAEQVKEKFGTLCFYMTKYTINMANAILIMEAKSRTICEFCGAPGKINNERPWVRTLCDECAEARKK
jgi:hypothetical protein